MTETDWSAAFVAELAAAAKDAHGRRELEELRAAVAAGRTRKGTASVVKHLPGTNRLSFAPASAPSVCERLLSQARTDLLLPQPVIPEIEYG